MNFDTVIKNIKDDEYNIEQINNIIIKNYNNHKFISFEYFINEYICEEELDIEFLKKLFEIEYIFLNQNYFYEFGSSVELLKLFIVQYDYNNCNHITKNIEYYYNHYLFDKIFEFEFEFEFKIDDKYFNSSIQNQSISKYNEDNLITQKLLDNDNYYCFNPNYKEYDLIILKQDFFEYDDSETMLLKITTQGDIRIIKLYQILFSYGYKIKNNIIFFMLCWHISYIISDKYISDDEKKIIFKLFENEEFKNWFIKKSIIILHDSFDIIKSLNTNESYILEKLMQKINLNNNIEFPQFIYQF